VPEEKLSRVALRGLAPAGSALGTQIRTISTEQIDQTMRLRDKAPGEL